MQKSVRLLLLSALLPIVSAIYSQNNKLWYQQPAKEWMEASPLGNASPTLLPTDIRWKRMKEGLDDAGLDALFFQYGRYLLISSSRENSPLPANLQGIWNDNLACNMGWTCDYHLDINTEQNYWIANVGNLKECNQPLFTYLKDLTWRNGVVGKAKLRSSTDNTFVIRMPEHTQNVTILRNGKAENNFVVVKNKIQLTLKKDDVLDLNFI